MIQSYDSNRYMQPKKRRAVNTVCNLIIALSLLILLSPSGLGEGLVISGEKIITIDSDFTQVGNVLIQDSGTLVVKNGATLNANGYSVTVKGKGTLKIEKGILKTNSLNLYDESMLDMTQNSKLELNDFLSDNKASIKINNAKIVTNSFSVTGNDIEVYSGEIISSSSVSINVQSFSFSNSTIKGAPISIESPSAISIENSVLNGISYINCPLLYVSNSNLLGTSLKISCISKISITNSTISGVSSVNSPDVSISNSKVGGLLLIESSKVYISKSEISSISSIKADDFSILGGSKISGTGSFNVDAIKIQIVHSTINGISSIKADDFSISDSSEIDGNYLLNITSKSRLSISNSNLIISGGNYKYGRYYSLSLKSENDIYISNSKISVWNDNNYGGYDSSLSIESENDIYISNSTISGGNANGYGGYDSSLFIESENDIYISNSKINSGGFRDRKSFRYINFKTLFVADTVFNEPFEGFKNSKIAYFTNVIIPTISVKDDAVIYDSLYIIINVTDKLGHPVSNAKVDVLYYLNETTYKSEMTDSNGTAKIPVLSNIKTSRGDQFLGNYKVVAHYLNFTTPVKGVEMKQNQIVTLNFSDLVIEPPFSTRLGIPLLFLNKEFILVGMLTVVITVIVIIFIYKSKRKVAFSKLIKTENIEKSQQSLHSVPGLFDTAKSLSSQANQLFQQKNYPSALQTYENALSHFTRAHEGAKALNDTDLANTISNNISAIQKNITACKNALGTDIASKARSKFEKGDFTGAIQTYEESLKYFQEPELISKTKANVENCYIEIDARKVEELSTQAVSLLKEAAALNEPFKAIEKLNQANNRLNDAVALATKRKFADALSQLNTISKNIQDQRNIVHDRLSSEPVISENWNVEQLASKKAPAIQAAEHGNRLKALRESEFFNGFIRIRLSVSNKMSHTVTDVLLDIDLDENILRLDHYEPDTYAMRKGKIHLGNITPNNDKTIAVYLDPLTCSKEGTDVNCRIDYKDAYGKSDSIRMEPLKIPFTCPIFDTEQDINIGRLKELVAWLPAHGSRVFSLSRGVEIDEAMTLCREVIQMHDVRHVRNFKTIDGRTAETWYYGKTKVEKIDLIIKATVKKENESIEVFVAAPDQKALTGLLAQLGGNLTEKGKSLGKFVPQLNLTVKDSVVKGKRLLDLCDKYGNCGANVIMEDSVLY